MTEQENYQLRRLEADDDLVLERTQLALEASQSVKPTVIRCRACGHQMGMVGRTEFGPLLVTSWVVEVPLESQISINDVTQSRRASYKLLAQGVVSESGPPLVQEEVHGVIALLALSFGMTEDYPDLLVRCNSHGDVVLTMAEARAMIGRRDPVVVAVSLPMTPYRRPRDVFRGRGTQSERLVDPWLGLRPNCTG